MSDVVVVVTVDSRPVPAERLGVLVVTTEETKAGKRYTQAEAVRADYGESSSAYAIVKALFGQEDARPQPEKLIQDVTVVGFGETASGADLVSAIDAYRKTDDDWYLLLTDKTDASYIQAVADYIEKTEPTEAQLDAGAEDHRKFYVAQTVEKDMVVSNARCAVIFTNDADEHADAAWVGAAGAWYPRYVTWKFKMPSGVTAACLDQTEKAALELHNINYVTDEYKKNYIKNGVCANGEWIDSLLGGDWIAMQMRSRLYEVFLNNPHVPYDNSGFTLIAAAVFNALDTAVNNGIIARDAEAGQGDYTVHVPTLTEATKDQRRCRRMPAIEWKARLSGAVHGADVSGKLVVEL